MLEVTPAPLVKRFARERCSPRRRRERESRFGYAAGERFSRLRTARTESFFLRVARKIARNLRPDIGDSPVPGALGLIAAQAVSTAPADGYTLLGGAASIFTILPAQKEKKLTRDPFASTYILDFLQVASSPRPEAHPPPGRSS